jgi:nitrile hydratase subunit beta
MSGYHDIGGQSAGQIPKVELPFQHWEKQTEAIRALLGDSTRRMVSLDEIRLGFESFGLDKYQAYSFYRRRLEAMIDTLVKKGLITRDEFEQELLVVQANWVHSKAQGESSDGQH